MPGLDAIWGAKRTAKRGFRGAGVATEAGRQPCPLSGHCSARRAEMPGNGVLEQEVFLSGAGPDVMNDKRHPARGAPLADHADVRNSTTQVPGDEIAG